MKKIFTLAAAVLASLSMFAAVEDLNFSEPTELPEGYVYSATNTPIIATTAGKSAVYVTNGGGGSVSAECFTEEGLDASKGKRWMGFVTDENSKVVLSVLSGKKTWNLYNSKGEVQASFANTASSTWEEWTIEELPAGAYILTTSNSQCYVSAITFTGSGASTDPVSEVTVSGPTTGFVGIPVTLKAKTDKKADKIWWTDKYGTTLSEEAEFTFTPEAEGEVTYTAWAENAYNVSPALKEHTLTIAGKLCGELIKATHTGETTATVEGVIGGSVDKKTQGGGKLGSNDHYFGVKLASGSFQVGDEVIIEATTLNGGNTATIYSDKGTNLLGSVDFDAESLKATYTLTQNTEWVYLYRKDSGCNPTLGSISVNRSCEASNNANMARVYAQTGPDEFHDFVREGDVFSIEVPMEIGGITEAPVFFVLEHPKATANETSPFNAPIPEVGAAPIEKVITVTAEDGVTTRDFTLRVARRSEASHDATLKSLAVEGFTLDPAFDPAVLEYTITKSHGSANPGTDKLVLEPNDDSAHTEKLAEGDDLKVVVTAEDGETKLTYVIHIVEAAAKKDLLEAEFSNGAHGFILAGNIDVPYLEGEAEPTFVSATFWEPDGEPKAEMVDGKLVVTGIDGQQAEYTITYHAITPMEYSEEEVVFSEVPSYIFSVYGFDADKGVKFSKDVEEATNRRISEGKDRIYIALPAANKVLLTSGTGAKRPVKILVNGEESAVAQTAASDEAIEIILSKEHANFVAIESNGSNGDGGFIKLQLSEESGQGIEDIDASVHAVKFLQNGQIFILRGEKIYTVTGQEL